MTEPASPVSRAQVSLRTISVVAVIGVVVVVAGVILAVRLLSRGPDTVTPVREAASTFLTAVRDGGDGYERLCDDNRIRYSRSEFERLRVKHHLTAYAITDAHYANTDGHETGTVTATLSYGTKTETHTLRLVREAGAWRICGGQPY